MPVLNKQKYNYLNKELTERFNHLINNFKSRELKDNKEGVKGRGQWKDPSQFCATEGDEVVIRLAIENFKPILSEIKKLKDYI